MLEHPNQSQPNQVHEQVGHSVEWKIMRVSALTDFKVKNCSVVSQDLSRLLVALGLLQGGGRAPSLLCLRGGWRRPSAIFGIGHGSLSNFSFLNILIEISQIANMPSIGVIEGLGLENGAPQCVAQGTHVQRHVCVPCFTQYVEAGFSELSPPMTPRLGSPPPTADVIYGSPLGGMSL